MRRLTAQVDDAIKQLPLVAETTLIGGARGYRNLGEAEIIPMLTQANRQVVSGKITAHNQEMMIETGGFVDSARDLGNVVVGLLICVEALKEAGSHAVQPSSDNAPAMKCKR